ncbi:acyl-CoA dehydrogenase family protein [Rhodococcoides kyotonense]|uniref:Acyl-CoA dehydrogenase n=1 Tax=Rhodococcoides kyotonense TaxID=398843 RepID=A0A239K138_9NOCA|nr:acyl-CoA dehydrogenase family protein [Rhodococcus kyotonensis]SNT11735.1 Acyl-CoA dehydrogenase [Rhodococcus kyotonensis]
MRFTDEQQHFARAVRDLCDAECGTLSKRDVLTENGTVANSPEILAKMAKLGWLGVSLPEQYGGGGAGMVDECIFLEETSRGLAPIIGYSTGLTAVQTYLRYGTEEQKKSVVTNMASGKLEAIALSEPGAGSDLGGVRIKAERVGDHYIVNGQKTWISAAHVAENILLLVREDSSGPKHQGLTLLMVPTDTPGLTMHEVKTMEARTCNDLYFTDAQIPVSAVVGQPGQAWKHLMRGLSVERLIIATMSMGAAQRSLDDAIAFVKDREQFGRSISSFQAIRHRIADLATEIDYCRTFVYSVAERIDAGEEDSLNRQGSMAKLKCTEIAKKSALEAMQMMGGYGYAREYGMEEQVRRSLAPPIYGGTNEIQRDIISKSLGL